MQRYFTKKVHVFDVDNTIMGVVEVIASIYFLKSRVPYRPKYDHYFPTE